VSAVVMVVVVVAVVVFKQALRPYVVVVVFAVESVPSCGCIAS